MVGVWVLTEILRKEQILVFCYIVEKFKSVQTFVFLN